MSRTSLNKAPTFPFLPAERGSEHLSERGCCEGAVPGQEACRASRRFCKLRGCALGRRPAAHRRGRSPGHGAAGKQWSCRPEIESQPQPARHTAAELAHRAPDRHGRLHQPAMQQRDRDIKNISTHSGQGPQWPNL